MRQIAKPYAESFYKSKAWQDCRRGYIDTVNGLCERCLERDRYVPGKVVHHKEYITPQNINNPYVTLSWDNLEYLCQDCHNREHHAGEYVVREDVEFDEEGNLIGR